MYRYYKPAASLDGMASYDSATVAELLSFFANSSCGLEEIGSGELVGGLDEGLWIGGLLSCCTLSSSSRVHNSSLSFSRFFSLVKKEEEEEGAKLKETKTHSNGNITFHKNQFPNVHWYSIITVTSIQLYNNYRSIAGTKILHT